ncbi:MAG: protein arginine kinase [Clostridia bacterium]|nr:protein arginine kinase [Clostridia bacterium]
MSWYSKTAPRGDIVVSTRIRLARNIKGMPFPSKMTAEQFCRVNELVRDVIFKSNSPIVKQLKYIKMDNVPEVERFAMVERHIISREFALNYQNRAIIISDDEEICIMLGEEDHIRIQVVFAGLQPQLAYNIADDIDNILCQNLDIAFDERLGFLTECPTNLGTGLRASVMLHLPIMEQKDEIGILAKSIRKQGFTIRGMYGEGSKALGSLYQVSNQVTLGVNEQNAINSLERMTYQIIGQEEETRKMLNPIKLQDRCMRSYGILKNSYILSSQEMMARLSDVKLGISEKIVHCNETPIKLMIEGSPYMITRILGYDSPGDRDIIRAKKIRETI